MNLNKSKIKKISTSCYAFLYKINNPLLRKCLRALIAKSEGGQAFSLTLREIVKKYHGFDIGIGSYGPCFNPEQTWIGYGNLSVGKFCSLASGVCLYSRNHPYWHPSTSPLFYNSSFLNGTLDKDTVSFSRLRIGNDVWIGQYAVVLPSCNEIGNGAVIGAGSIVTKDVPPYAVVAGNPAKVLKYRFDEETIDKIESSKWWDWDIEFLVNNAGAFQSVEDLLSLCESMNEKGYL